VTATGTLRRERPDGIIDGTKISLIWRNSLCNAEDIFRNASLHYAALVGNAQVVKQDLKLSDFDLGYLNFHYCN
jgi:hypothetical protein